MNHRIGRNLFALAVGLAVAIFAYQWAGDPEPQARRVAEERAVEAARVALGAVVDGDALEIVDPLAPNRKVGKVYVYAEPPGWAVSGFYRRNEKDRWHPYLLTMNEELQVLGLKVQDASLAETANASDILEVVPGP